MRRTTTDQRGDQTNLVTSTIGGWLRLGGAGLLAFSLLACASGSPSPEPTVGAHTATPAASTERSALEMLTAVLDPIRAAAEFESVVTLDGTTIATVTGRTLAGSSQVAVTREGRTVEYVQVPPSAWARDAAGKWVLVTAADAPTNPIEVLAAPASVGFADGAATGVVNLVATYPAAALGLGGDSVAVAISIDGTSVTFRYETAIDGHPASTETTLRPATVTDPIVPPLP